jgi:hypothetical protein
MTAIVNDRYPVAQFGNTESNLSIIGLIIRIAAAIMVMRSCCSIWEHRIENLSILVHSIKVSDRIMP